MRLGTKWIAWALLAGFFPYLTGCATVLRGTGHGIGISSQPAGAEVVVDNKVVCSYLFHGEPIVVCRVVQQL